VIEEDESHFNNMTGRYNDETTPKFKCEKKRIKRGCVGSALNNNPIYEPPFSKIYTHQMP